VGAFLLHALTVAVEEFMLHENRDSVYTVASIPSNLESNLGATPPFQLWAEVLPNF